MSFEGYLSLFMVFIILSGFVTSVLISKESHMPYFFNSCRLKANFKLSNAYEGVTAAIVINITFQSYLWYI
ncbi:hypothetical protein GCM10025861_07430 [Methanobacterium petrolearium]|nr:hypothetical protein GCM10025861_07430 [Methanobacterium petrolearium]